MITNEMCKARLKEIDADYRRANEEIMNNRLLQRAEALNQWAQDNSRFAIGDIIQCYNKMICVDKITGETSFGEKLYCIYHGPVLTKQMKPRKDGERTHFYDDGREIKLIKSKEC